jgi:hypothetical protein
MITIQYLEDSPELLNLSPQLVGEKLNQAFQSLPITHLLIGWNLPAPIFDICRKITDKNGLKFIRWHPLLTGDDNFYPKPEWQVVGLNNQKVPGFQNMPEFTFVCPNHPEANDVILNNLQKIVDSDLYDGIFLDRIRFPSPAANPLHHLGCFCSHCQKAADKIGIDLKNLQKSLLHFTTTPFGKISLVQSLLGNLTPDFDPESLGQILPWLAFRCDSINHFAEKIAAILRPAGFEIGLDCFSPGLTSLVGQNIGTLSKHADWIKIMCYAHTLGPAGLPFEILGLFEFLTQDAAMHPEEALKLLSTSMQIPLPGNKDLLITSGLSSNALALEIKKGMSAAKIPLLAGLELVEIPGVSNLNNEQIIRDHHTVKNLGVDGLSISWDLWNIPQNRLNLLSTIWCDSQKIGRFHEN